MNVPIIDLKANYNSVKQEVDSAIQNVLDDGAFVLGKYVEEFERNFAAFCNYEHAAATNSGTAALQLALIAAGVRPGDEVITTPFSFFATAEAISLCGAVPKFVDVDPETYNLDFRQLDGALSKRTKAIVPVHLYGQPADVDEIVDFADEHDLRVIEDCCQAHNAVYRGKKIPVAGTGCFSFYPTKNLGAFGEAGIVVSSDDELIDKVKLLRAHYERPKNVHNDIGYNYRMEGFQGAILNAKLKKLDEWTEARRNNAKLYNELLKNLESKITLPKEKSYVKHVFHLYAIQAERRDELKTFLEGKGISTGIHYPTPIHLQPAYEDLGYKEGSFPNAEAISKKILSLPMYPELAREQIEHVANAIREFCTTTP
ncbi:MAG: DegT/DnrJ/EryC1/StrS family aminotransferase [Candidatus Diapherotrites archaeon]|nr:DegT/DnrJ/EryC1/StrS family aminotransferase [Candidatus Diapherotrites archaeon]